MDELEKYLFENITKLFFILMFVIVSAYAVNSFFIKNSFIENNHEQSEKIRTLENAISDEISRNTIIQRNSRDIGKKLNFKLLKDNDSNYKIVTLVKDKDPEMAIKNLVGLLNGNVLIDLQYPRYYITDLNSENELLDKSIKFNRVDSISDFEITPIIYLLDHNNRVILAFEINSDSDQHYLRSALFSLTKFK